jgi:hypothetical protein
MEQGFNWEDISKDPVDPRESRKENIEGGDDTSESMEKIENGVENVVKTPGVIGGKVEKRGDLLFISTEFGNLKIPEDKFKSLFGDKVEGGNIKLTPLSSKDIINELLFTDDSKLNDEEEV